MIIFLSFFGCRASGCVDKKIGNESYKLFYFFVVMIVDDRPFYQATIYTYSIPNT